MKVDNFLQHYGVMGMKWGKRKNRKSYQEQVLDKTPGARITKVISKNGDVLSVNKTKLPLIGVAVAKLTGRKPENNAVSMNVLNKDGTKVGSFIIWKEGKDTVRGEWLEIKPSFQGRGYSEAAIRGLIKASKNNKNIKNVRLQVPSNAAPAKHIYTKLGFKKDKDLGDTPIYGNLEDWLLEIK